MKEMTRPQHEGILSSSSPTVAASKIVSLNEAAGVRAYVDFAGMSADGDIALIGWLLDREAQVQGFSVAQEVQGGLLKRRNFAVESLVSGVKGVQLERVLRADVTQAMASHGAKAGDKLGFVLVVPKLGAGVQIALQLKDGRHVQLSFSALKSRTDIRAALQRSWEHSGTQLASCLRKALGEDDPFVKAVGSSKDDDKSVETLNSFAACDHAFVLAKRALVLHGWVAKAAEEIARVELVVDGKARDITAQVVRYVRPDLFAAFPWSEDRALGFFCVLTGDVARAIDVRLKITCHNGARQLLESDVGEMTWAGLGTFINAQAQLLTTPLLNLLAKTTALDDDASVLADRIAALGRESFVARHPHLPAFIEHPATVVVAVDRAYPLGRAGLLIYGWHLMPQRKPRAVYLRNADGDSIDVTANFTPLLRADVAHNYRARFPQVDDWCGFVCLAPMTTRPGESRVLAYDFDELGEVWVKVPVLAEERSGERLVNELVTLLPPAQYRSTLLGIGAALKQSLIFQTCIEELEDEQIGRDPATSILTCENAMVLNGKALLLQGWIGLDSAQLSRVELVTAKGEIDITDRIGRTMRTDLAGRFPWANESPAGFIVLLEDPALIGQSLRLRVIGVNGQRQLSKLSPYGVDWSGIANLNKSRPEVEQTVLGQLLHTRTLEDDQKRLADRVAGLRRENFLFRHPHMPVFVDNPATVTASLDRAYALGQAGVLVFGWKLFLKRKPVAVYLRNAEGESIDVTATFTPLLRADVSQNYRSRFPQVDDWCGFVALMPLPTRPGEARALYFDFGELGEVMMKLPISAEEKSGERLVSELIGLLPPAQYRSTLLAIGDALDEALLFRASIEELEDEQVGRDPATSILACDQALIVNGKALLLHGWIGLDAQALKRVELVTGRGEIDITDRIVRIMRTDLAGRFSWAAESPVGFVALLEDPALIGQSLRLRIIGVGGERQLLKLTPQGTDWAGLAGLIKSRPDFERPLLGLLAKTRTLEDDPKRLADRVAVLRRENFLFRHPHLPAFVDNSVTVAASLDRAYALGQAGVLVFGWKVFPKREPLAVYLRNAEGSSVDVTARMTPLLRADVSQKYRPRYPQVDDWCGFVALVPMPTRPGEARALCFDFGDLGEVMMKLPISAEEKSGERLVSELIGLLPPAQYRSTLLAIGDVLDESLLFRASIEELEDEQVGRDPATSILGCEQALIVNGKALLLHGWIGLDAKSLSRVELVTGRGEIDITDRIVRTMRTDLAGRFSWAAENPAGFIALLEDAALIGQSLRLRILGTDGERQLLKLSPNGTDWAGLAGLIKSRPDFETPLLGLLAKTRTLEDDPKRLADRLDVLRRDSFLARHPQLPAYVEQPARIISAIDRAYCLGEAGLLIFGWKLSPKRQPVAVRLHNADGESIDITDRLRALIRPDVAQTFRARFANTDDNCGYVCFAPMPTNPGEARALCFDFGEQGEVWLKVPTEKRDIGGIDLIKEVLGMVPSPDRMRHRLYELFSSGFGDAVEAINRARPPFQRQVEVREFGEPVAAPGTSIIVPLYGRYDFLRFQLANFADDPDFANVDLIYVVDDPNILSGTLELAARYQPLFGLPFRVAWYGENRGFAGANNIGVSLARGENLVLLNSDVIPVHGGWLTTLTTALDTLPDAGMVGPLLLFGDNSIQHAGMYPRTDTMFPGFLLNTHKGMGTIWEGGEQPSEHPMLTAACVVLKTQDFRDLGGFDEGYVIGDFEDSDLCLALRKKGKGMWLVPEARLWHLERQSQNLSSAVGQRQMVTLFNGWRYNEKIRAGIISNPVSVETKE